MENKETKKKEMKDLNTLVIFLELFVIHASYATFNESRKHVIAAQLLHAELNSNNTLQLPMPLHSMIAHFSDDGEKLCAYNFITKHLNYNGLKSRLTPGSTWICGYYDLFCRVVCDSHRNVIEIAVSVCD